MSKRKILLLLVLGAVIGAVIGGGLAVAWVWSPARPPTAKPLPSATASRFAAFTRLNRAKALASEGKHTEALAIFDELASAENGSGYGWDADIQAHCLTMPSASRVLGS